MRFKEGDTVFELIAYKDVKLKKDEKNKKTWKTIWLTLVPKTTKIEKMKKWIPNIEELFEKEENKTKKFKGKVVKKDKVIDQNEVEPMIED